MRLSILSATLFCLLVPAHLFGNSPEALPELVLTDVSEVSYELTRYLALYVEDGERRTPPAAIFADDALFTPHAGGDIPNFGFSDRSHWVMLRIRNETTRKDWRLSFNHPAVDQVRYFLRCPGQDMIRYEAGDQVPQSVWPIRDRRPIFPLTLEPGARCRIYLNLTSTGSTTVPLTLYTPERMTRILVHEALIFGSYYGIMIVIILFNLILWIRNLDPAYFWNFFFMFIYTLGVPMLNGLAFQYLWPQTPGLNNMLPTFFFLCMFGLLQFARIFLNAKVLAPVLDRIMLVIQILIVPLVLASLFVEYKYSILVGSLTFLPVASLGVITAVYTMVRGYRPAVYYVLGWGAILIGILVYALQNFGIVTPNFLTNYGYQIGSVFEALFVSVGIANRLRILRDEVRDAQIDLHSTRRQQQSQKLHATRLELEMLKRTIQPHFLLNSLNAAQGWLEVDPKTPKTPKPQNPSYI